MQTGIRLWQETMLKPSASPVHQTANEPVLFLPEIVRKILTWNVHPPTANPNLPSASR